MAVRTKGRNKFEFHGRLFVWHVENDQFVRIAASDKQFVIVYSLDANHVVKIIGREFSGLSVKHRPVYVVPPDFAWTNFGALIGQVLSWALSSERELQIADERDRWNSGWRSDIEASPVLSIRHGLP